MVKEFFRLVGMRLISIPLWIAMTVATVAWYTLMTLGVMLLAIPCWLLFGDAMLWKPDDLWFMWYYDQYYDKIKKLQDEYNNKYRR